jgi:hypothetical protein
MIWNYNSFEGLTSKIRKNMRYMRNEQKERMMRIANNQKDIG